jgi:hypothetical protein
MTPADALAGHDSGGLTQYNALAFRAKRTLNPARRALRLECVPRSRKPTMPSNSRLWKVAHEAMRARGLLPDFSHDVIAEVNALHEAARDPSARDMRDLPWASIDNDDSRDLDQLSVAADTASRARTRSSSPSPTSTRW